MGNVIVSVRPSEGWSLSGCDTRIALWKDFPANLHKLKTHGVATTDVLTQVMSRFVINRNRTSVTDMGRKSLPNPVNGEPDRQSPELQADAIASSEGMVYAVAMRRMGSRSRPEVILTDDRPPSCPRSGSRFVRQ